MGDELVVEMHGTVVGRLARTRRERVTFVYSSEALDRWSGGVPVVSLSLPVSSRPLDATTFLDGLLPEGDARRVLAERAGVLPSDVWGMLSAFGRDVAGAMVVSDPQRPGGARTPRAEAYADWGALAADVDGLAEDPLGADPAMELSLAGMQEKLLLVSCPGTATGWGRPLGGLPSTHILKPSPRSRPGLVALEGEALALAQDVGLTSIDPTMMVCEDRECLVVSRYDRETLPSGEVVRLHQEDLCQATGKPKSLAQARGRGKFQQHGGPSLRDAADFLTARARDADAELERLVGAVVFTVLTGNCDAHGKNLSLMLSDRGEVSLAPLYDTVPTMLVDGLAVRMAMWVGGVHTSPEDVTVRAMVLECGPRPLGWGLAQERAERAVGGWVERVGAAALSASSLPGVSPVADYVVGRVDTLRRDL